MTPSSQLAESARPESLVRGLIIHLGRHALWDSLLIFVPPVLAVLYALIYLGESGWFSPIAAVTVSVAMSGLAVLVVLLRYRPLIPPLSRAAQMADERTGAKDHFLTLSTIDPAVCPETMLARLRRDTEKYVNRIVLRRDFPYEPKRSSYLSAAGSLLAILLLYGLLPPAGNLLRPSAVPERLVELADRMAQAPRLKDLSEALKSLAAKIDDPKLPSEEKLVAVQELEKTIAERQKKEQENNNRDLLGHAASALKEAQQQQLAEASDQQKDGSKGGGNLQSNLPQEGKGESKQSQDSGGDGNGDMSAQPSKDIRDGRLAPGDQKKLDINNQQGGAQGNQPDPGLPGKEESKNKSGAGQGGSREGRGKEHASEEPPQSAPPTERFYKAGEGPGGIKGARYITVQLPEDVVAESNGKSAPAKDSKGGRNRPPIPVSNIPLPAHFPNAPTEKQQMPVEYRGIIR